MLLCRSNHIIGHRYVLCGHNEDEIGMDFLCEFDCMLSKLPVWNLMYLVFNIILDEILDCKIQVNVCLCTKTFIGSGCPQDMDLGVKIFSHENCHSHFLLVLYPEIDREDNVMISFLIGRRILHNNKRDF